MPDTTAIFTLGSGFLGCLNNFRIGLIYLVEKSRCDIQNPHQKELHSSINRIRILGAINYFND